MGAVLKHEIVRGRMTPADKATIEQLAASMLRPTPGKIAAKINRHPATVAWFMLTRGLVERKPGRATRTYQRNGVTVHPYTEEHDAFIQDLRKQGLGYRQIALQLTARFGIHRNGTSVNVRLVQLAAAPDE